MHIEEMTMGEFSAGLMQTRTVLLPFGSTEEHGSHLPLATDTLQAVSIGRRIAELRPIFIAPPVPYGVCRSSFNHPGTLSITTETLKALMLDIADALYRQGLRNLIFLSGHAGGTHMAALTDAGEQLLQRYPDIRVAILTEYLLAAQAGRHLLETKGDAHAGEIETSRILNSHPHLVKGSSECEFPNFPPGILVRNKTRYWPGGVWGDPGKASAKKGAQIEDLVVEKLNAFIDQFEVWQESP
jgi:creatinine amidohydrolase